MTLKTEKMAVLRDVARQHGYSSVSRFSAAVLWGVALRWMKGAGVAPPDDIAEEFRQLEEWEREPTHVFAPDIRKRR